MTSKEKVRAVHPRATAEKRKQNGGAVYWLIRSQPGAYMPIGDGKTQSAAWVDAARKLPKPNPEP